MTSTHQEKLSWSNVRQNSSISSLLNDKQSNYLLTPSTPDEIDGSSPQYERPYVCKQCDQSFSRAHNLKSHLATHSTERPFQCHTCNHYFRRQHDLKRHQKLHTGERPHVCKNCGRSFARLDALNRHQRAESNSNHNNTPTTPNKSSSSTSSSITTITTKSSSMETVASLTNSTTTSTTTMSGTTINQRPTIPQLNIPNPASKPLRFSPTSSPTLPPQLTSSPKSINNVSLPPLRSPSFKVEYDKSPIPSPLFHSNNILQSPPYRSYSYPTNHNNSLSSPPSPMLNRFTLPSLPSTDQLLHQQLRNLEQENIQLKQEIKNMSINNARVHDLEVENKLLKSLIQQQQQPQKQ